MPVLKSLPGRYIGGEEGVEYVLRTPRGPILVPTGIDPEKVLGVDLDGRIVLDLYFMDHDIPIIDRHANHYVIGLADRYNDGSILWWNPSLKEWGGLIRGVVKPKGERE